MTNHDLTVIIQSCFAGTGIALAGITIVQQVLRGFSRPRRRDRIEEEV